MAAFTCSSSVLPGTNCSVAKASTSARTCAVTGSLMCRYLAIEGLSNVDVGWRS
jgi:hypothetical protein